MPDKPLTIATYAAGASLAAITLVYVFAPTFFIDGEAESSTSSRKRGVVGLVNPANDCFINSTVQALAGLGDLRVYLIRETYRRKLDGASVYKDIGDDLESQKLPTWKVEGLQKGLVTQGLKDLLDALNERPLYKKTISAAMFVKVLETAFKQRISRQQQDAQEFLQVVAERLCDEYHAGHRARQRALERNQGQALDEEILDKRLSLIAAEVGTVEDTSVAEGSPQATENGESVSSIPQATNGNPKEDALNSSSSPNGLDKDEEEEGFPMEGLLESQIECLTCGFKPKPTFSTFCTLTLNVPQVPSTTLNACFDGMFKTEYIEDFKCEKCRLIHAVKVLEQQKSALKSEAFTSKIQDSINKIQKCIDTDPEDPPRDIELPESKYAPRRKIARHVQMIRYPKILAIHLSRSIFDNRASMKNSAKIQFPERLPIGGLLDQKKYKLLTLVMHKGSHHSGHYETFRRQNVYPPFSTPNTFDKSGVYSRSVTPMVSHSATPRLLPDPTPIATASTPELLSPETKSFSRVSLSSSSSHLTRNSVLRDTTETSSLRSVRSTISNIQNTVLQSLSLSRRATPQTSAPTSPAPGRQETSSTPSSPAVTAASAGKSTDLNGSYHTHTHSHHHHRKKKENTRWWRISDDKIKESKTSDVLKMQKEVYLLFYELERD